MKKKFTTNRKWVPNKEYNAQRQAVFLKSNGLCFWCGCCIVYKNWELDHRIPYSLGGKAGSNLNAVCRECNKRKGILLPEEFALIMSKDLL